MNTFLPRVNIDELLSTDSLPAPARRTDAPKKEVRLNGKISMLESESELVPMIRKPHQPPPHPSRGRLASPTRSPSDPTSSARASEKPVSHITRSKSCDEINERPLCRWIEIKIENYRRIKVQRHLTLAPRVFLAV